MHPPLKIRYSHFYNPYIKVIRSSIHHKGIVAKKDIPKNTRILQYLGEHITKTESEKRSDKILADAKKNPHKKGAVYIFTLNNTYDIDGQKWYNLGKYMNHSCNPNSEAELDEDAQEIWVRTTKDIKKGDEITYDYGYDLDHWEEHPCHCGSPNCVGYIVAREHWSKLRKILEKRGEVLHPLWGKKKL
ncbi:MAG: SET domain-containing protein [Candidatus Woesearchaeota archaeon]